jgi:hypothetical protein
LKVSYRFLQNVAYGAATVDTVVSPWNGAQAKAKWMGKWQQDHEGWRGTFVVRRITNPENAADRLGTYYANGSYASGHSVNGISIDGDTGLRFFIASETENTPGTLTGQKFEADQYGLDSTHASGMTWFGTTGEGGLHLGRSNLSMPYSNTFSTAEWVGTWDMNSNGNLGTLTITSITPTFTWWGAPSDYAVNATLFEGGVWKTVTGTLERDRPSVAHLNVTSGSFTHQRTLRYHFWEDRLATGFATSSGITRTGVHAVKR